MDRANKSQYMNAAGNRTALAMDFYRSGKMHLTVKWKIIDFGLISR